MDKGNVDEVNYFDFCNDIDSPEQLFGVGRGYNHSFDYYPKQKPRITGIDIKKDIPNDVEDVLAKLRKISVKEESELVNSSEILISLDLDISLKLNSELV